jgi:ATP-dependent Clp protease ATP-binding subunit ClpC
MLTTCSPAYGARPLRRVIQKKIEDEISEEMLLGRFKDGDIIQATLEDTKVTFEKTGTIPVPAKDNPEESVPA